MPSKSGQKKRKAQPSPKKPNYSLGKVGGTDLREKNKLAVKNPQEVSPAKKKITQERNQERSDVGESQKPPKTGTNSIGLPLEQKTTPTPQHTDSRSLYSTEGATADYVAPVVGVEAGHQPKLMVKEFSSKKGKRGEGRKREEEDTNEEEKNKKNKKDNQKEEEDDMEIWSEREELERRGEGREGAEELIKDVYDLLDGYGGATREGQGGIGGGGDGGRGR